MNNHHTKIDCLIWDCDGCLIDSEILACSVSADLLGSMGYNITPQDYIDRFAGKGIRHTLQLIEQETGRTFLKHFPFEQLHTKREKLFKQSLKPIDGVKDILHDIDLPMCIASGSEFDRLNLTLSITNLKPKFTDRIFSAEQVQHGKPAPDLFLFAAAQMNISPTSCLVIEDSVSGIKAAKSAGMPVFGFIGASHATPQWKQKIQEIEPTLIFDNMRDLPKLIKDYSNG